MKDNCEGLLTHRVMKTLLTLLSYYFSILYLFNNTDCKQTIKRNYSCEIWSVLEIKRQVNKSIILLFDVFGSMIIQFLNNQ